MRILLISLFLLAPGTVLGQSKTPSGFTIRISPTDSPAAENESEAEPDTAEQPRRKTRAANKRKKSGSKLKKRRKASKRKSRRRMRKQRVRNRSVKPQQVLAGTGARYARQTPWGIVETTSPRMAATVLARAGGVAQEDDRHIVFQRGSVALSDVSRAVLGSMSDLLEVRPEIGLLLLEGHADDGGSLSEDQLLSEARASSVREFLIGRGVSPGRVLAYGLGRSQSESSTDGEDRKVILRLVEPDSKKRPPSKQWSRAAVVQISGSTEGLIPGEEGEWRAIAQRDELAEDAALRTGANGQMLLRFPDSTTIRLEADTEIKLENLDYDYGERNAELNITVRRGSIVLSSAPKAGMRSQTMIVHESGSVRTYSADLRLSLDDEGHGSLSITRGTAQVVLGQDRPITLGHGQRIAFDQQAAPSIRSTAAAPMTISPLTGSAIAPVALSWQAVAGIHEYVAEISSDIDFFDVKFSEVTSDIRKAMPELTVGETYFWRVFAVDENGQRGASSQIHRFTVSEPPRTED